MNILAMLLEKIGLLPVKGFTTLAEVIYFRLP